MPAEVHSPILMPRNRYDWRIVAASYAVLVPLAMVAVLGWCALPALLAFQLTHNVLVATAVALAMDVLFIQYFARRMVRRIRTDDSGMMIDRFLGPSVFVPWDAVQECTPSDRATYVRDAWFRLPPPLQSASLAASGQYRIRWNGGEVYFPPRDAARMERCMARIGARESQLWYRSAVEPTETQESQTVGTRRWWS